MDVPPTRTPLGRRVRRNSGRVALPLDPVATEGPPIPRRDGRPGGVGVLREDGPCVDLAPTSTPGLVRTGQDCCFPRPLLREPNHEAGEHLGHVVDVDGMEAVVGRAVPAATCPDRRGLARVRTAVPSRDGEPGAESRAPGLVPVDLGPCDRVCLKRGRMSSPGRDSRGGLTPRQDTQERTTGGAQGRIPRDWWGPPRGTFERTGREVRSPEGGDGARGG